MTVVVNDEFFTEAFGGNDEALRAIRSKTNDFANDSIRRDFYRGKPPLWRDQGKRIRARRGQDRAGGDCSAQKASTSNSRQHEPQITEVGRFREEKILRDRQPENGGARFEP